MSVEKQNQAYRREELSLIAILFFFFFAIVAFSLLIPFDARLFPIVVGTSGIIFTAFIAGEQGRSRLAPALPRDDPAAKAGWRRYATALLSAPVFGVLFWLFGFVVASLTAMLLIPILMGYRNRWRLLVIASLSVAILALIGPHLLNVELPHGLVGNWLIDRLALRPS